MISNRTSLAAALLAATALLPAPVATAQNGPDFSRTVFLGDSLTAGFQDGALHEAGQRTAYPVHVARAVGAPLVLPLVDEPGVPDPDPARLTGLLRLRPGTCSILGVEVASGRSEGRLNPDERATNLAVPGHDMGEAVFDRWSIDPSRPETIDTAEDLVLGLPAAALGEAPASQLETAVGLDPTFVVVWLGANDALGAALDATVDRDTLTPLATFEANAERLFDALEETGAEGVVVNVPDVTVSPFLYSVDELVDLLRLNGLPVTAGQLQTIFGIGPGSYTLATAVASIARGRRPADDEILTPAEVRKIRKRTKQFNRVLRREADRLGWAYVDAHAFLTRAEREGIPVDGVGRLTTKYLGGIFSLDGVHPTNTGQALVAGLVIDAINATYGTSFAAPDVTAVAAADPLLCGVERP